MRKSTKWGKEGLEEHLQFVKEFRASAQTMVEPEVKDKPRRVENKSEELLKRLQTIFSRNRRNLRSVGFVSRLRLMVRQDCSRIT